MNWHSLQRSRILVFIVLCLTIGLHYVEALTPKYRLIATPATIIDPKTRPIPTSTTCEIAKATNPGSTYECFDADASETILTMSSCDNLLPKRFQCAANFNSFVLTSTGSDTQTTCNSSSYCGINVSTTPKFGIKYKTTTLKDDSTTTVDPSLVTACNTFFESKCHVYRYRNDTSNNIFADAQTACNGITKTSCTMTTLTMQCYSLATSAFGVTGCTGTIPSAKCLTGCTQTNIESASWLDTNCKTKICKASTFEMTWATGNVFNGSKNGSTAESFLIDTQTNTLCQSNLKSKCFHFQCTIDGTEQNCPVDGPKCLDFTSSSCTSSVSFTPQCINVAYPASYGSSDCGTFSTPTTNSCFCSKLVDIKLKPADTQTCSGSVTADQDIVLKVLHDSTIIPTTGLVPSVDCGTKQNCVELEQLLSSKSDEFKTKLATLVGTKENPTSGCGLFFPPSSGFTNSCCKGAACRVSGESPVCFEINSSSEYVEISSSDCSTSLQSTFLKTGCEYLIPASCEATCRSDDTTVNTSTDICRFGPENDRETTTNDTCEVDPEQLLDFCVEQGTYIDLCSSSSVTYHWTPVNDEDFFCTKCEDGKKIYSEYKCTLDDHETAAVFGERSCRDTTYDDVDCTQECDSPMTCTEIDHTWLKPAATTKTTCHCANGKIGEGCDKCPTSCQNGGSYTDEANSTCKQCSCPKYFAKSRCECRSAQLTIVFTWPGADVNKDMVDWAETIAEAMTITLNEKYNTNGLSFTVAPVYSKKPESDKVKMVISLFSCEDDPELIVIKTVQALKNSRKLQSFYLSSVESLDQALFDMMNQLITDLEPTGSLTTEPSFHGFTPELGVGVESPPCDSTPPTSTCPVCVGSCGVFPEEIPPPHTDDDGEGSNAGTIVGIVLGCIFGIALIGAIIYWLFFYRKSESRPRQATTTLDNGSIKMTSTNTYANAISVERKDAPRNTTPVVAVIPRATISTVHNPRSPRRSQPTTKPGPKNALSPETTPSNSSHMKQRSISAAPVEPVQQESDSDGSESMESAKDVVESSLNFKLPPNWERCQNEQGLTYYWNSVTEQSSWDRPAE